MKGWPRLTMLLGPTHPHQCQRCGGEADLSRWQEHDAVDQPEPRVVVLCLTCEEAVIEKHPRLYRRLEHYEPFPGSMHLCVDCEWREGVTCSHPDLMANGGPGLAVTPTSYGKMFLSPGGAFEDWGPTKHCAGRSEKGTEAAKVVAFIGPHSRRAAGGE